MAENEKTKLTIFQRIEKFGDLFFLNLLFVVSCVPIVTIGAAITAMFSYTLKLVNDEELPVWKGYWKAFKRNCYDASKAWAVLLVIFGIFYLEFRYSLFLTGTNASIFVGFMAIEAIFLSLILPILFPLISRYENTTGNMFKNSFIIAVSNIGSWIAMFLIWVLPIIICYLDPSIRYICMALYPTIIISVQAYATSMILDKIFKKIDKKTAEREEAERKEIEKARKKAKKKSKK